MQADGALGNIDVLKNIGVSDPLYLSTVLLFFHQFHQFQVEHL